MGRSECAGCGTAVRGRRLCTACQVEERYGQGLDDESDEEPQTVLEYECTACGNEFESANPGACPECGAHRRRYIGELEGAA